MHELTVINGLICYNESSMSTRHIFYLGYYCLKDGCMVSVSGIFCCFEVTNEHRNECSFLLFSKLTVMIFSTVLR